jgi:hypothetical protein
MGATSSKSSPIAAFLAVEIAVVPLSEFRV